MPRCSALFTKVPSFVPTLPPETRIQDPFFGQFHVHFFPQISIYYMWGPFVPIFQPFGTTMSQPGQPPTERRQWVRYPAQLVTICQLVAQEDVICSARIQNVSQGGLLLLVNRGFDPGDLVRVLLKTVVEVRVVHPTSAPDGNWLLGCAFTKELGEGDKALLKITN